MPSADAATRQREAQKELAAITGFTSAIAAFVRSSFRNPTELSIDLTGGVQAALWGFFIFGRHLRRDPRGLFIPARVACFMTSNTAAGFRPRPSPLNKGDER